MAATEPFQSKYRREPRTTSSGTASRRRVFEADGNEREPRSSVSVSNTSSRSYARGDRSSNDRTESPSSVTSRMNKLNLKDDKDKDDSDKEEDKPKNNDDEEEEKKSLKKERGGASANSARKRQARKNLREKRRSTGVVIMPGQPVAADDEDKAVQENTAKNMEATASPVIATHSSADSNNEELLKQIQNYEQAMEDWQDELAKAKHEIESLRKDNQRLKDENSALLRVVGSLSGTGGRK